MLVPIVPPGRQSGQGIANFYVLNGTAEALWERLATPADEGELVAHLLGLFDVDGDTARRDVAEFLTDLRGAGAVEPMRGESD